MGEDLLNVIRRFLASEAQERALRTTPVLVWIKPGAVPPTSGFTRLSASGANRTMQGSTVVLPVEKTKLADTRLIRGVTFGRTQNNDIVLADSTVSGFHGYFETGASPSGWTLQDSSSRNGTRMDGMLLKPNQAYPVPERAEIKVGGVALTFMTPPLFFEYIKELVPER